MTAQPDQPARHGRRRWLRILNITTVTLAIAFAGYRYALRLRTQVRMAEVHRQGYPVTSSELETWYPKTPPGENAADVFVEAFHRYASWETNKLERLPVAGKAQLPPHGELLTRETRELVTEYLTANHAALDLLHKGAAIRHSRYPVDFRTVKYMLLKAPHLNPLRQGARLLCLEAVMRAEENNPSLAADSVASGFGLADSLATEPYLISQLVRGACYHYACLGLERTLNRVVLTDKDLAGLMTALPQDDCAQAMRLGLIAERSMTLDVLSTLGPGIHDFQDYVVSGKPMEWGTGYQVSGYYLFLVYYTTGFTDQDMLCYMDLMEAYIRICERPAEERLRAIQPMRARNESLPHRCFLSRALTGDLGFAIIKNLRLVAEIRVARGALDVEQFRLSTGRLPDNLVEISHTLLNAIPLDPFDAHPLRYKRLAKGYVVYSVGDDGRDDGGDEKKDITFTVER